jgi:rod shape-determining protein MreB
MGFFTDLFSLDIGIDLGTATTLVYVRGEGIVLCEPSVVAIDTQDGRSIAWGSEAKRMLGRTPGRITAIRPMRDGVIADFQVTQEMLRYFIAKVRSSRKIFFPWVFRRVIISVPSGITEVERRAVEEAAIQAGAHQVYLTEEPMSAAIGSGLPVSEPTGSMVIDIGGGTTEVAVISLGGIVVSKSVRVAGDAMDEAISQHIKNKYRLMIGERTAEEIKIRIGSADILPEETSMVIKGRDLVAGLPRTIEISSEEVREALREPISSIVDAVKSMLERTPPELASDIFDVGITLAGGGAQLRGLDTLLTTETGLPVKMCENPETAIVLGTGKQLDNIHHLAQHGYAKSRGGSGMRR